MEKNPVTMPMFIASLLRINPNMEAIKVLGRKQAWGDVCDIFSQWNNLQCWKP